MNSTKESPSEEMQRLFRKIAGKAVAGEKDEQLRGRAARRMNMELRGSDQIGARRAKSYWHRETTNIPSIHMDVARSLAFVAPIEEAINAVETAEKFLDGLRGRLLDRAIRGRRPPDPVDVGNTAGEPLASPARRSTDHNSRSAVLGLITSSRSAAN